MTEHPLVIPDFLRTLLDRHGIRAYAVEESDGFHVMLEGGTDAVFGHALTDLVSQLSRRAPQRGPLTLVK